MIITLNKKHIPEVVRLHLESFRGFFLTFLGPRFLRVLYTEIILDPQSIALGWSESDKILGFVVGVEEQSNFYRRLLRRRWYKFAATALGRAILHPRIIPRLLRAFLYPQQSCQAAAPALLMSIAVSPKKAGAGIGKQLVNSFAKEMRSRGIRRVSLTTDAEGNDAVNAFYRSMGYELYRSYMTPEGRAMNEYVAEL